MSLTTIILAAGKSTRMLSLKSKILFKISAEPIIQHVYNAAKKIKSNNIVCVLSNPPDELTKFIKDNKIQSAMQLNPFGTADAVKSALKKTAKIVDKQNSLDNSYIPMSPSYASDAFLAASDLITKGREQPSGYTEPVLHLRRLNLKMN